MSDGATLADATASLRRQPRPKRSDRWPIALQRASRRAACSRAWQTYVHGGVRHLWLLASFGVEARASELLTQQ
eukprot:scaffold167753_cov37-Tisochrysis_lutea.AAC.2